MFTRSTTLSGHSGKVRTIAASERGNIVVSAGDDLALCVWDSALWSNKHVIRDMDPDSRQAIMILDVSKKDLSSPQRQTFRVPPNPKAGFDGIVVRCQVLECEPPSRLASRGWPARSAIRR